MKLMPCPLNGPRNISEFVCGGPVVPEPDPETSDDRDWSDYLFLDDNPAGIVDEWWCHTPTAYWFIARRDTRSEDILETFTVEAYAAGSEQSK